MTRQEAIMMAMDNLNRIIVKTDAEWDALWSASVADERRIEDDARKFAAGIDNENTERQAPSGAR